MRIIALLANYAEAIDGRLFVSGGGIEQFTVQPGTPGPWGITCAIAAQVKVPWTETNRQHVLTVDLVDEDDRPAPVGPDGTDVLHAELPFAAGRGPEVSEGTEQAVTLALTMAGIPLARLGAYNFRLQLNGETAERLPLRLVAPAVAQFGVNPAGS